MTTKMKIYISAAAVLAALFLISSLVSRLETRRLEKQVEKAESAAAASEKTAAESETKAARFKEKIEYLETNLSEIRLIARKQDEELEKIYADTRTARDRMVDARRVRTIATTADELCEKLARVGHPCE